MSRAFVDEDASIDAGLDARETKIPVPPGSRNYLTPEGARRLHEELSGLVESRRPSLASEIARLESSSASSDLDTIAMLRQRLASIDRRIEYLGRMASLAEVIDYRPGQGDRVVFGARVRVEEGSSGERVYRIVGADESDPENGLLSWCSPLARALIGKKAGDCPILHLPGGDRVLRILAVE
ncbi:MAG TPA: GreA/GreB family elongation factor [Rectinemataceae bacterium]|nr:GreA/GreB family elongation factor [Rectinemataceae bacterium]